MGTMLKQEFKLLKIGVKTVDLETRLNRLGEQGWTLVPLAAGAFMPEHLMLTRTDCVNSADLNAENLPGEFTAAPPVSEHTANSLDLTKTEEPA